MGLREPTGGNSDPSSAISSVYSDVEGGVQMKREASVNSLLPDLEKLSLEKGRPLDVEDLDDDGWHAASEQKKIVELGSLGEGAGGAVTRCKLKEGKTVFALKVSIFIPRSVLPLSAFSPPLVTLTLVFIFAIANLNFEPMCRSSLPTQIPTSRNRLFAS